ncbi:MAG: dephospho-CoA kinase [Candidatus Omnitrophota bacterium]
MLIVGITGSLATGKTTVAKMFKRYGAKILDADQMAHQALDSNRQCFLSIVRYFGKEILDGKRIDRKKLADIVFEDPKKLKKLVSIIHPVVVKEIRAQVTQLKKSKKSGVLVLDVPLLIEAGLHKWVDFLIVVKAGQKKQVERAVKGKNIASQQAVQRIKSQMPLSEKIKLADIVIDNNKSLTETRRQVSAIWARLRKSQTSQN